MRTREAPPHAQVLVEDNGAGISLSDFGRIFEPFFTTREGRQGLGLSISYRLAKQYGGDLRVDSVPGRTCFLLELPLVSRAEAGPPSAKVLILDDEPAHVLFLEYFLTSQGYTVSCASDGNSGLARIMEEAPAVVLLDILLPGVDGLQVLSRIRARSPDTVVIMTTGVESKTVAQEALKRGVCAYLQKPLDLDQLLLLPREATKRQELNAR